MQNKRILLKLSGEALAAPDGSIYDHGFVDRVASVLTECARQGYELGVVIGAHCGPGLLTVFYLCAGRQPE